MSSNVKAIILAAGRGKRMMPLTNDRPKCLLKAGLKTILQAQLDSLVSCGIDNIIIVIGYLGQMIEDFVNQEGYDKKAAITFAYNEKFDSTGSCFSLLCAKNYIDSSYIHLNSDLVFDRGLLVKLLNSNDADSIITDRYDIDTDDMVRYSTNNGKISNVGRPSVVPEPQGVLVGPAKFSLQSAQTLIAEIENEISMGQYKTNCYLTLNKILDKIKLYPVSSDGLLWKEFDTAEELREYNR